MSGQIRSRPNTPDSPLTSSLYRATSTIDDLTRALTNFSRVPSPELPATLACCCGKEACENLNAWLALKTGLESRLILSAEVGQALLQRHEAYVRQHENTPVSRRNETFSPSSLSIEYKGDDEYAELMKEKAILQKRLNQALVNNEMTEISNKSILQELQDARSTISRLTSQHARSVGWEARLSALTKERDDMVQERDGESYRAKLAESRLATLKEKTAKLQVEVKQLQASLEEKRLHRLESSESLLQDARGRLQEIYKSQIGLTAATEQNELMKVLESLVVDNETLKRDNGELQQLLMESREDLHALQEEIEEQRANNNRPNARKMRHLHGGSAHSLSDHMGLSNNRSRSAERKSQHRFLLTPEISGRPLSPAISLSGSDGHWPIQPKPKYPSSYSSIDVEDTDTIANDTTLNSMDGGLFNGYHDRGVQTGKSSVFRSGPQLPHHLSPSPHDPRSETSSSLSESLSSHIGVLLERVDALLTRMTQADALTLRNRLKRQHLQGADVGHLSRSTVGNIVSEATALRIQFRVLLEDDNVVATCTRKDLRVLFKLIKEVFVEIGQLRMTLNEVVLDPSTATKISERALNPAKAESDTKERGNQLGWMAPISKLFAPTGRNDTILPERATTRPQQRTVRPSRFIPKSGPALSASATTVNVEFSGSGGGRSMTSTSVNAEAQPTISSANSEFPQGPLSSSGVMDIFAGAPLAPANDPWVVVPLKAPRRVQSFMNSDNPRTATIGRFSGRQASASGGLSRNVDAVIDNMESPLEAEEEADYVAPLLERTLRRRGLSDSSIHSTFTSHGADDGDNDQSVANEGNKTTNIFGRQVWPDRGSVFQALSRTVQTIRTGMAISSGHPTMHSGGSDITRTETPPPLPIPSHERPSIHQTPRKASSNTYTNNHPSPNTNTNANANTMRVVSSPQAITNYLPTINLTSWATSGVILDPATGTEPFIPGSVREESYLQRTLRPDDSRGGTSGRDFY